MRLGIGDEPDGRPAACGCRDRPAPATTTTSIDDGRECLRSPGRAGSGRRSPAASLSDPKRRDRPPASTMPLTGTGCASARHRSVDAGVDGRHPLRRADRTVGHRPRPSPRPRHVAGRRAAQDRPSVEVLEDRHHVLAARARRVAQGCRRQRARPPPARAPGATRSLPRVGDAQARSSSTRTIRFACSSSRMPSGGQPAVARRRGERGRARRSRERRRADPSRRASSGDGPCLRRRPAGGRGRRRGSARRPRRARRGGRRRSAASGPSAASPADGRRPDRPDPRRSSPRPPGSAPRRAARVALDRRDSDVVDAAADVRRVAGGGAGEDAVEVEPGARQVREPGPSARSARPARPGGRRSSGAGQRRAAASGSRTRPPARSPPVTRGAGRTDHRAGPRSGDRAGGSPCPHRRPRSTASRPLRPIDAGDAGRAEMDRDPCRSDGSPAAGATPPPGPRGRVPRSRPARARRAADRTRRRRDRSSGRRRARGAVASPRRG